MRPLLDRHFGNPSSGHWAGMPARDAVETARREIASLLQCETDNVLLTSGGSEANNHAIKGTVFGAASTTPHLITTAVEHPALLEPCRFVERFGARVTRVPVDGHGLVDPDDIRRAITPETVLISVMHANNEVGTIQPIAAIARIAREHGVLCHTDAAQSVAKISDPRRRARCRSAEPRGAQALRAEGGRSAVCPPRRHAGAAHPWRRARTRPARRYRERVAGGRAGRGLSAGRSEPVRRPAAGAPGTVLDPARRRARRPRGAERAPERAATQHSQRGVPGPAGGRDPRSARRGRCVHGVSPVTPAPAPCRRCWPPWASRPMWGWAPSGSAWGARPPRMRSTGWFVS